MESMIVQRVPVWVVDLDIPEQGVVKDTAILYHFDPPYQDDEESEPYEYQWELDECGGIYPARADGSLLEPNGDRQHFYANARIAARVCVEALHEEIAKMQRTLAHVEERYLKVEA